MVSDTNLQRLKALSVELRELDLGTGVQRVAWPLTPLAFYRDYVSKNKPCILTGAVDHWPALKLWNKKYFAEKLGAKQVTVAVTPDGRADAVCQVPIMTGDTTNQQACFMLPCQREMPFAELLDRISYNTPDSHAGLQSIQQSSTQHQNSSSHSAVDDNADHRADVMYLQQQDNNLRTCFPEAINDVDDDLGWASEAFGAGPDAVNLWIGSDQSVTSFHKDHYENLYAVVAGEKVFTLLPPCDSFRMHLRQYPVASHEEESGGLQPVLQTDSSVLWSPIEDLADKSCRHSLQKYPLYSDPELPKPMRVTVRPGEVLFLPSLWWHQVEQHAGKDELVIAVNYWYDMQFDCKYAYFKLVESMLTESNIEPGQQECV